MDMLREEVSQLIEDVFESDWSIKVCGRDKCKRLMFDLEKLFPGEHFGDTTTGFMQVCKIKEFALMHKLCSYT